MVNFRLIFGVSLSFVVGITRKYSYFTQNNTDSHIIEVCFKIKIDWCQRLKRL